MFDIDGTLIDSFEFDEQCYIKAVEEALDVSFSPDWQTFPNITDSGILAHFLQSIGRIDEFPEAEKRVKEKFIEFIRQHVKNAPAVATKGAISLVEQLLDCSDVTTTIATGGWLETARLKLTSAGFDTQRLAISSSNDHHVRSTIMKIALGSRSCDSVKVSYFGDGPWDKEACDELGFNFIAVGNKVKHHHQIEDFSNVEHILAMLKLNQTTR